MTRRFTLEGFDLVHGNELLAERDPSCPREGARYVRTQQHTIEAVMGALSAEGVALPIGWGPPAGIESPVDVFGGYLLLDAWIGNTDRHHENWALVVNVAQNERHLAPTFDHASSLGAHELDEARSRRLEATDPAFTVESYVQRTRVRSALYAKAGDAKPLGLIETVSAWSNGAHCAPWLDRLRSVREEDVDELIARVPASAMSGPARAFTRAILESNRRRILGAL